MKYSVVSLLLMGLFPTLVWAQNIPNSNFASAIRAQCPACIDANNNLLAPAQSLLYLDVSSRSITSLQGVSGFSALQILKCQSNALPTLPTLPTSLKSLYCSANNLTALPVMPSLLDTLDCSLNSITALPSLPASLKLLNAAHNRLSSLPTLPAGLFRLEANGNLLTALPALPSVLRTLHVGDNQLSSLPALPASLDFLNCGVNPLTNLPALPAALTALTCNNSQLSSLPTLPSNLEYLYVHNNQLASLPALPNTLQVLYCQNNQIANLPPLPTNLTQLYCRTNPPLVCLPLLPLTLGVLITDVSCLPNIPVGIAFNNTLPVCNNSNACGVFAQLIGRVYTDYDNNCVFNPANDSTFVSGILVKATDAQNNVFNTYTDAIGQYAFALPAGQYTLQAFPTFPQHYTPCSNPVVTIASASSFVNQPIGFQPLVSCPILKVDIDADLLRRCFTGIYTVKYQNLGTTTAQNAYIDISFDSYLSYVSNTANISATNLGNNTYRFPLGSLSTSQSGQGTFKLVLDVSCNAQLGQVHCTEAHIYPAAICNLNWNGAVIEIRDTCTADSVTFRLLNTGASMANTQNYQIIEDNLIYRPNTPFQLPAGGSLNISIPAQPNRTYRIEAQQAAGFPAALGGGLAWAIVQNCNGVSPVGTNIINQFNTQNAALAVSVDCTPNRGAYDPNQKSAQQIGYGSQHFILANTPLEYKIEFQNTGTDTAFRVVILDTLDTNVLDPASIQIGTSSHAFTWALLQNNILKFTFDNIQLVDSFANEPLSHGYVTFNIAQQSNLAANTIINNKAAIYFDFNAPVITNTCFHTIGADFVPRVAVSVGEVLNQNIRVKAYPNPFQTESTLEVIGAENQVLTLKIVDAMGKTVQTQQSSQSTLHISRENLPTGVYFYQLFGDGQLLNTGKLIAE